MFTGLIEEVGSVVAIERQSAAARLTVSATYPADEVRLGDSIAVNGICLTVVAMGRGRFTFDVSPETFQRTAFGRLTIGSPVNLERALRLSDRLGGHLVTGHVDCIATIRERGTAAGNTVFFFSVPPQYLKYLIEKGSVAIDGISLTVNTVTAEGFSVNVIPHTGGRTTLNSRQAGAEVNIETDILGKYVERLLKADKSGGGVSLDMLARNGFL